MLHFLSDLNFNFSGDHLISCIRKLAKSSYWQTVYGATKELHFKLFDNQSNFSELQILFLNYLGFYSMLNMDIVMGDVTDIVLENEIYEESYMYYKQKVDKKKIAERPKHQQSEQRPLHREEPSPQVNWVFKKPKKA